MDNVNRPADQFVVLPGMRPTYTTHPRTDVKGSGEKHALQRGKGFPNRIRHMVISVLGEFVGTTLFLFFAFAGTQVANTVIDDLVEPHTSVLLYIALAFGFSLAVNVWIFFRISGGLFNPAVSIALALVGAIGWLKAALCILAQILGGIAAAGLVSCVFPGPLAVRTTLSAETSVVRGLFIEMFLTAELVLCIFMLAAEKHRATFLAPIGIGLALFIAELAGVYFTGGSLNPARSFGPDVILRTFNSYHWIYWVGPILGAIVAVGFYRLLKFLEYETANPGADSDGRPEVRYSDTREPVPVVTDNVHHPASEFGPQPASRYMTAVDTYPDHNTTTVHRTTTDGTDESDFAPPFHATNRGGMHQYGISPSTTRHEAPAAGDCPSTAELTSPSPVYGIDGHRSHSANIDHPNDRPRAHHHHHATANSSRTLDESEHAYRGGPTLESATSTEDTTSSPSS